MNRKQAMHSPILKQKKKVWKLGRFAGWILLETQGEFYGHLPFCMFEIQGKMNTAVCYAKDVEDGAIEQIRRMCDYELTKNCRIRIMPDVHAGKGCTIGTTMTVSDKTCPNIVGVDIGCGMYTVKLAEKELDFERIDASAHFIPSGMNTWEGRIERYDLTGLKCFRSLRDTKRLARSLGTLGGMPTLRR